MANIGTFTAKKVGFSGQLCTLILNVKVRLVPNDDQKGNRFIYWSTVRYWPIVAIRIRYGIATPNAFSVCVSIFPLTGSPESI